MNDIIAKKRKMDPQPMDWQPSEQVNPGEGRGDSWQMHESVQDFVRRLPPLTTPSSLYNWIWVYNPHCQVSESTDTNRFVFGGQALLQQSLETRSNIQSRAGFQSKVTTSRLLSQESDLLQQRITNLATEANVRSGKACFTYADDASLTLVQ